MTSQEIVIELEALRAEAQRCVEGKANIVAREYLGQVPLWEIAYQLAKQTEQHLEMIQLMRLQVSRINPQPLADPQPGKMGTETVGPGTHFQHYYSTACQHNQHESCRQRCKFCQSTCLCACHSQRPQPSEPVAEAGSQGRREVSALMNEAE